MIRIENQVADRSERFPARSEGDPEFGSGSPSLGFSRESREIPPGGADEFLAPGDKPFGGASPLVTAETTRPRPTFMISVTTDGASSGTLSKRSRTNMSRVGTMLATMIASCGPATCAATSTHGSLLCT